MQQQESAASSEDEKLVAAVKRAVLEVLYERRDLLREVLEETMEDIAVARAVDTRKRAEETSRNRLFVQNEAGK
jgi:hypothetical protein